MTTENEKPTPRRWTSTAGPIQTKKADKSIRALAYQHQCYTELSGTIGVNESRWSYSSPMGGGNRDDVTAVQAELGERYDYTVTAKNYQAIIADIEKAMITLRANTPIIDKRITPEAAAERDQKNAAVRLELDQREATKREQAAGFERDLRAQYPWAKDDSRLSSHARAAANLRAELALAFPGITFKVRSECFSGGDSVHYSWTLGPTGDQVREIAGKYKDSSFDGMTDSQVHDGSAYGAAVEKVLGRVTFCQGERHIDETTREVIGKALCAAQQVEFHGDMTMYLYGSGDSRLLREHVSILISETAFPPGAAITGVEHINTWGEWYETVKDTPQDDPARVNPPEGLFTGYRVTFSTPTFQPDAEYQSQDRATRPFPETGETSKAGVTVAENPSKGGIEIRFASKPDDETRSSLKANGFRWSRFQKLWYAKLSPRTRAFAEGLAYPNSCPVEDPDCMGAEGECHDACEALPHCSRCGASIKGEGNIGGRCHNTAACNRRAAEDSILDEPTQFDRDLVSESVAEMYANL